MTAKESEKLARMDEKVKNLDDKIETVDKKLDKYFQESREFHSELLNQIEKLTDERVEIATLKEKVKTQEKIVWTALTASIAGLIKLFYDLVSK